MLQPGPGKIRGQIGAVGKLENFKLGGNAPKGGLDSRRDYLNKKFGRTGDLNTNINKRGAELTSLRAQERVYNLAKNSDQDLVIGRLADTKAGAELGLRRLNDPDWDKNLTVNDAWIYGGIAGRKRFYIGSPQTRANKWDFKYKRPTVFGLEVEQLERNGYIQEGNYFVPPKQ